MEVLRCRTPAMVEKELWVHLLAYNLIRVLMAQAAAEHGAHPRCLSFKHTVQLWNAFCARSLCHAPADHLALLLRLIAEQRVGQRPGRIEPRARKRRPKPFQWLKVPRHIARMKKVHGWKLACLTAAGTACLSAPPVPVSAANDTVSENIDRGINLLRNLRSQAAQKPPASPSADAKAEASAPEVRAGGPNSMAASLDIVGLRIGMTPDDVRATLRKHLPGTPPQDALTEIRDYPGSSYVSAVYVSTRGAAPDFEIIVVHFTPPPSSPQAVRIARRVHYSDAGPSLARTLQALGEKYGETSSVDDRGATEVDGKRYYWAWNAQGARQKLASPKPCNGVTGQQELIIRSALPGRRDIGGWVSKSNIDDQVEAAGCALMVAVSVEEKGGIVKTLNTNLVDFGLSNDALETTAAHVAALKKEAADAARSRADERKPSL